MSFLWGPSAGQAEFDALLEKTTSDALPSSAPPDLLASLQLADLIRSSAIPPAQASKSLFKRLQHTNPNVQLLGLAVLDICVKNGGTPFLQMVSSSEFATDLEALAKGTSGTNNRDVKEKVAAKLQDWAVAFSGKDGLRHSEMVRVYERMKRDGYSFPARDPTATAAMVDSLSAPDWKDAAYCTRCRTDFTTFNRKHHCRNCGDVFDQQCSSSTHPLPHYGITESVRVCDGCLKKLKEGKGATVALGRSSSLGSKASDRPGMPERSSTVGHGSSSSSRRSAARTKEDGDLQRAIAASLADSGSPSSTSGPAFQLRDPQPSKSGYNPTYSASSANKHSSTAKKNDEEEDPDLAAAIAASLRDVAPAPSAPSYDRNPSGPVATYASLYPNNNNPYQSSAPASAPPPARYASLPSYDLSPTESTTLNTFTSILSHPPPQLGHHERRLYEEASLAAPRLERGLQDAERRKEILVEMNQKLAEAARMYQGALEAATTSQHYRQPQQQGYSGYTQPVQQHYAPQQYQQTPQAQYTYQPQPMGQPLPFATLASPPPQQYQQPQQYPAQPQQPAQQTYALPAQQVSSPQAQPQPAGYYKPSQFPQVPKGPEAMLFPSVPHTQLQQEQRVEIEDQKVGELIEL